MCIPSISRPPPPQAAPQQACQPSSAAAAPQWTSDPGAMVFINLLAALVQSLRPVLKAASELPPDAACHLNDCYDFVIVGAGTAGATLAGRLSENKQWKVLALDAGVVPRIASEVPGLAAGLQLPSVAWSYEAEPQSEACVGLRGGACRLLSARLLGGGSAANNMLYLRGHRDDFDSWKASGNAGWGYDDVLPLFKKSEDAISDEIWALPFASYYHSRGGPLSVSVPTMKLPILDVLQKGAIESNFTIIKDFNRDEMVGYGIAQFTLRSGIRYSSAKAFLVPAKDRRNLKIVQNATVTKILINSQNTNTYGVEFVLNGTTRQVTVKKEVIISGGALNSPKLLMLSGIGKEEQLSSFGIPLVHNSSVGDNFQDHVMYVGIAYVFDNETFSDNQDVDNIYTYLRNRTGPLSEPLCERYIGLINTVSNDSRSQPRILASHYCSSSSVWFRSPSMISFFQSLTTDVLIGWLSVLTGAQTAVIASVTLLHPRSRGTVQLRSGDAADPPLIRANYLTDSGDVEELLDGVQRVVDVGRRIPGVAAVVDVPVPACESLPRLTRDYWRCSLPYLTTPALHPVGTCRMGVQGDAVVDPQLRVRGVRGLRVADSSVFPTQVSGNTEAAIVMVAEKAAELIESDWRGRFSACR